MAHVHALHLLALCSWSENILWPQNNLVKHSKEYFKAEGISNAAEPGCAAHSRFYVSGTVAVQNFALLISLLVLQTIFHSPLVIMGTLLTLQMVQIVFELYLLIRSSEWHRLLTVTMFVMLNSVTLFKLARQYLVMDKIYHAEKILQERLLGG